MDNYRNTEKSIMISAPAGSGKTQKLAGRYIALLQSGVDIERILAVTFTDKAAAEMKQRILAILKEEDPVLYGNLLERMPLMRVTTIHSFCGTLLRRFSFEAGINPDYIIEDAVDSSMAWEEALYEVLMEAGKGKGGHELFYETLAEKGFRGLDFLRGNVAYLYGKTPFSLKASPFSHSAGESDSLLGELRSWPGAHELLEDYDAILGVDGPAKIFAAEKYFLTEKKEPRKRPVPLLKNLVDYRGWAEKMHILWKERKVEHHKKQTERIGEIFKRCMQAYQDRKKRRGILDFSDLEYRAHQMLTEDPEWGNILYAFDEKTDHILVDEFQDTNYFQWGIINKLTEEWRSGMGAKREEGGRPTVFFVGDEKQSIYYFRGADVEIFGNAKEKLRDWLGEEFCYEEVRDNYRSLPVIIEFTNQVFSAIMQTGQNPFPWKTAYTTFTARRPGDPERGNVEIILLATEDELTLDAKEKEAEALARRINGLVGNYQVRDKSSRMQRPAGYMDIAILLRKRTHLKIYEKALRKRNIPFVAVKGIGFYQEPEVAMLRALVFFLSDPADDYSLYVLLKSPFFQMREDRILEVLEREGDSLYAKLLHCLLDGDGPGSGTDGLKRPAQLLREWLSLEPRLLLAELIEHTLVKTGAWKGLHEAQTRANVKKFIRIIEDLEAEGKSLIKIRDFLERTCDRNDEAKANVNTEGMDAVRIMTIHGSKGLEFPIVFVPGIDEPFSLRTGENLVYEEGGEFFYKFEPEVSLRRQDKDFLVHLAKEEEEQKRLFYVAVTRAEEALFLLGRWSNRDDTFLAYLKQGVGLEKSGPAFSIRSDIKEVSVLTEDDLNNLKEVSPIQRDKERHLAPVEVTPLIIQKQVPWRAVTETGELKMSHGSDWTVLGEILHGIFDGVSKGIIQDQDLGIHAEKMLLSSGFSQKDRAEKAAIIEKQIEGMKRTGLWQRIVLPREDSYAELPFVLGTEDAVYTGRIDRIIKEEGIYNIYDYKTVPVKEGEIGYLLEHYSAQLNSYKRAVMELFETDKVKTFVVFTHKGEVRER